MHDPLARMPIKYKLPLTFLVVCLFMMVFGGLIVSRFARDSMHEQIESRLVAEAEARSLAIASARDLLRRRVEDFASDGLIRGHLERILADDEPSTRRALALHLERNKIPLVDAFVDGAVYDGQGRRIASSHDSAPELFEESGASLGPSGTLIGRLESRDPTCPSPWFRIATPILDLEGTHALGYLVVRVHAGRFVASIPGLGDRRDGAADHELAIGDHAGRELLVPSWLMREGARNTELVDEASGFRLIESSEPAVRSRISAFGVHRRAIGDDGWTARVQVDPAVVMEPIRNLESRYLGTALVITVLAFGAILAIVHFIILPLSRLRVASERLAEGDLGVRVPVHTTDEIGVVAESFNVMASAVESRTVELRRKRDELQAVVASMRDGLCLLGSDGRVVLANEAAEPLIEILDRDGTRTSREACDGMRCHECLGTTSAVPRTCELEVGGRIYEVHANDLPAGGSVGGRLLVSRDITERLAMADRQAFHERMAVAGELASVVAHEVNNPLASIAIFAQMMADELSEASPFREHVDVIKRNTAACSRAVRDLLENVRGGTEEVGEVDLRDVVDDAVRLLRPLAARSGVTLRFEGHEEALVIGDETKLRQVVVNLAMNGIQATGEGGVVEVRVESDGDRVVVDVIDGGDGIPSSIRDRIFEPFFTTKGVGAGTGLGLPTARRTVQDHEGDLELVRTGESGTVFRIELPPARNDGTAGAARSRAGVAHGP